MQVAQGWRSAVGRRVDERLARSNLAGFPRAGLDDSRRCAERRRSSGRRVDQRRRYHHAEEFANFELELDFRITAGANSGIKYFVDPQLGPTLGLAGSAIGLEFQILDDELTSRCEAGRPRQSHGGLALRSDSRYQPRRAGSHGQASPASRSVESRTDRGPGRHVEHWLNGVKVVEYDRGTQMFRALVNNSKYKDMPGFGERERGPILLQDHGNAVSFRSIKIRSL